MPREQSSGAAFLCLLVHSRQVQDPWNMAVVTAAKQGCVAAAALAHPTTTGCPTPLHSQPALGLVWAALTLVSMTSVASWAHTEAGKPLGWSGNEGNLAQQRHSPPVRCMVLPSPALHHACSQVCLL